MSNGSLTKEEILPTTPAFVASRDGADFLVPVDYDQSRTEEHYDHHFYCYLTPGALDRFQITGRGRSVVRMRLKSIERVFDHHEAAAGLLPGERFPDRAETEAFFRSFPEEKKRDIVSFSKSSFVESSFITCVHTDHGELQIRMYSSARWTDQYLVVVE
ncbi:MAG: hypothetical protein WC528_03585 [Patescibacteria group bacterium]